MNLKSFYFYSNGIIYNFFGQVFYKKRFFFFNSYKLLRYILK